MAGGDPDYHELAICDSVIRQRRADVESKKISRSDVMVEGVGGREVGRVLAVRFSADLGDA